MSSLEHSSTKDSEQVLEPYREENKNLFEENRLLKIDLANAKHDNKVILKHVAEQRAEILTLRERETRINCKHIIVCKKDSDEPKEDHIQLCSYCYRTNFKNRFEGTTLDL